MSYQPLTTTPSDDDNVISLTSRRHINCAAALIACPADLSRESGLAWPVLVTVAAYADAIAWTEQFERRKPDATGQSERGRWADVLLMVGCAVRRGSSAGQQLGDVLPFQVWRLPPAGREMRPTITSLVVIAQLDDSGSPRLVVMRPEEAPAPVDGGGVVRSFRSRGGGL